LKTRSRAIKPKFYNTGQILFCLALRQNYFHLNYYCKFCTKKLLLFEPKQRKMGQLLGAEMYRNNIILLWNYEAPSL